MNNKGFTVVELIVSFVIVMTISIGLFKVVDSYREKQQHASYEKMTKAYANEVLTKIQTDVIDGGGIKDITPININDSGPCNLYSQGIKIKLRDNSEKHLCIGNGKLNSNKNGIYYNGFLYEKPSKNFIELIDDVLSYESEEMIYDICTLKKIWKINIKIKHRELANPVDIIVVSSQSLALMGDINKDGIVNDNDITAIDNYINHTVTFDSYQKKVADYDFNGVIDIDDRNSFNLCKSP